MSPDKPTPTIKFLCEDLEVALVGPSVKCDTSGNAPFFTNDFHASLPAGLALPVARHKFYRVALVNITSFQVEGVHHHWFVPKFYLQQFGSVISGVMHGGICRDTPFNDQEMAQWSGLHETLWLNHNNFDDNLHRAKLWLKAKKSPSWELLEKWQTKIKDDTELLDFGSLQREADDLEARAREAKGGSIEHETVILVQKLIRNWNGFKELAAKRTI